MQKMERDFSPERPGDELRALNRGDESVQTIRFLDVPDKHGFLSTASSSSDFGRDDTYPIYHRGQTTKHVVSVTFR